MYLPTIKQLQYLLAVVELRHFGQAAERCFVTQSTLSSAIQELEASLGVQLLERTKRKVMPTPLGLAVAEKSREVIRISSDIIKLSSEDKGLLSGEIRLGAIPTIAPFLLPKVLAPLRQAFPELALLLIEDQSADLLKRLESGEIDCAIFATPYSLGKLESARICEEQFWVALPKNDPLADQATISAAELPMERLLLLEDGHCMRDHAISACHGGSALSASAAFQGTSLYTLIEMVSGGQGITFVPEMALDSALLKQAEIELRPLAEKGPHRGIALVWRPTTHLKPDLQLLASKIAELITA